MDLRRIFAMTLLISVSTVSVRSLSVLEDNPKPVLIDDFHKLPGRIFPWPPGPITVPPRHWPGPITLPPKVIHPPVCPCVIRCCEHALKKRSTLSAKINSPLIRHKRCCGCVDCHLWKAQAAVPKLQS